jgi:WS/DGAT/MGAT family acyltransferase
MIERVSAADASNLRVERYGAPTHMAALALLDEAPLLTAAGQLRLDAIREYVEHRIRDVRRLRQVLVSQGRGRPGWVDAAEVDLAHHVRARRLPAPADEETLLQVCTELNQPPLDRSRPLWDMWLLTGLVGNRVGLLIRLHHVVADGMAALALLAPLFEAAGEVAPLPAELTAPATSGARAPGRVAGTAGRLQRALLWPRQLAAVARLGRAPALSFNHPVGQRRRVMLVRADLPRTKAVAHRHDGTVNDVVLAAVAGGARRLLESRGELTGDLVLKVSVITSIRGPQDRDIPGNRVGVRVVPVALRDPDPARRLEQIAAITSAHRALPPYQPSGRLLQHWMVRVMSHQRLVNLLVSNLPGPPGALSFGGSPVRELFQFSGGGVQGNLSIAVGVLSYAGQLNINVAADADLVPDLDLFVVGVADSLERLGARHA